MDIGDSMTRTSPLIVIGAVLVGGVCGGIAVSYFTHNLYSRVDQYEFCVSTNVTTVHVEFASESGCSGSEIRYCLVDRTPRLTLDRC